MTAVIDFLKYVNSFNKLSEFQWFGAFCRAPVLRHNRAKKMKFWDVHELRINELRRMVTWYRLPLSPLNPLIISAGFIFIRSFQNIISLFLGVSGLFRWGRTGRTCPTKFIPRLFSYKIWAHRINVALLIFHWAVLPLPCFEIIRLSPLNNYWSSVGSEVSVVAQEVLYRYFFINTYFL